MSGEAPTPTTPAGAEAPVVLAERPGAVHRAGSAAVHFFTEQFRTTPTDGMSEHFGHASKRNDPTPNVDAFLKRRLGGRS